MVELINDGFEDGDFSAWTGTGDYNGGTPSVQAGTVLYGSWTMEANTNGTSGNPGAYAYMDIAAQTELYCTLAFQCEELPDNGHGIGMPLLFENQTNGGVTCLEVYNDAGSYKLHAYSVGDGSHEYSGAIGFAVDTEYCLSFYTDVANNGTMQAWLDGSLEIDASGIDTNNNGNIDRVVVGMHGGYTNCDAVDYSIFVDAVVADNAARPACPSAGVTVPVMWYHYGHRIGKIIRG